MSHSHSKHPAKMSLKYFYIEARENLFPELRDPVPPDRVQTVFKLGGGWDTK